MHDELDVAVVRAIAVGVRPGVALETGAKGIVGVPEREMLSGTK